MSVKVGDRIRFLNDIGGGVVTGFKSTSEVLVEQEDGFEFPFPISECVVVESGSSGSTQPVVAQAIAKNDRATVVQHSRITTEDRGYLYLAFAPVDMVHLDESAVRVYLVNNGELSRYFSIMSCKASSVEYTCRKSGVIAPNERILVEELPRQNLIQIENLCVQMIGLRSVGTFKVEPPIDKRVNIKLVKFSKRNCFSYNSSLGCEAMVVELSTSGEQQKDVSKDSITLDNLRKALSKQSTIGSSTQSQRSSSTATATPQLLEIDLHIGNLLDSTAGMSSGDILEYQLAHFRQVVAINERYRGMKLVFIHGKGEGVLRNALLKEIKRMGREKRCQEASFKKYGFGALMLTI